MPSDLEKACEAQIEKGPRGSASGNALTQALMNALGTGVGQERVFGSVMTAIMEWIGIAQMCLIP